MGPICDEVGLVLFVATLSGILLLWLIFVYIHDLKIEKEAEKVFDKFQFAPKAITWHVSEIAHYRSVPDLEIPVEQEGTEVHHFSLTAEEMEDLWPII